MKSAIIRTGFDTLYFSGAHIWLRPLVAGVGAILTLHHVRPPRQDAFQPNRSLEVSPDYLCAALRWLQHQDIDVVSLDEMHHRLVGRHFSRRFVCLTLDDGYRDNKVWAYPIFKRYGAPFAIYVPTSFPDRCGKLWWLVLEAIIAKCDRIVVAVDGRERRFDCASAVRKLHCFEAVYGLLRRLPAEADVHACVEDLARRYEVDPARIAEDACMSWQDIRELAADPLVTVGVHTVNHRMLAKASEAVARAELETGREALEAKLGVPALHLAYPYGSRDLAGPREFHLAAELGFKTAVTTRPGVLFPEHTGHLTALPRLSLNGLYQRERYMKVLMSGAGTGVFNAFRRVNAA